MNSQTNRDSEPDPDSIKMFVGQIPRTMDENDLRKMFEEFGPIYQLNVLRDKVSGQSKGGFYYFLCAIFLAECPVGWWEGILWGISEERSQWHQVIH